MLRTAKTENGIVKGLPAADPRITSFKGIPFAAAPVGKNRWRAPQPAENWEGVREAFEYGPISMQSTPGLGTDIYCREWHVDPEIPMSEDCLYLNIWTGAKSTDEKLPVLVWYFGGGLQWGYTPEMEFDGERIARRGVIVVSVGYRLNCFGFLAHPELTAEAPEAPTNFGNLDQKAGLEWVIRNIAAFGGDPKNITIAGQSAGGGSVLSQMACPDNVGKFQKAIVMSAMIRSPYEGQSAFAPWSLEVCEKKGQEFFEFLGVKTLEEARALDARFIRDKYDAYMWDHGMMMTVQDNKFCVGDPMKLYAEGKCVDVPVMAGNTSDEFLNSIQAGSEEELTAKVKEIFGDKAEEFLACPEAHKTLDGNYSPVSGIMCTVKGEFIINSESEKPRNNYYYCFDPDIPGWDNPGTFHSVDLWFFFETLAKCWRPFAGRHYDLARQMCNYYSNFIKTGDPNGNDADGTPMPVWEPYTASNHAEMIFTKDGAKPQTNCESAFTKLMVERVVDCLKK